MSTNTLDNNGLSNQQSAAEQTQRHTTINNIVNDQDIMKSTKISKDRKSSFWSRHESFTGAYAFAIFTSIVIAIAIIIICVTAPKKSNGACPLNFIDTTHLQMGSDSNPRHIALGDFNNDNNIDFVVANYGVDNVGIFLGDENGSFASQITYSTGKESYPSSVGVGDFNKDNQTDIVVANYGNNNIGLFLGDGHGGFASQKTVSLNSWRPLSLVVDDINKDDYLDIVVVSYGTSNIVVLLGYPNGSFKIEVIYDMGYDSIPYSLAVKDFDNDNHLDIAIVNYGINNLVILLANGNGSFEARTYSTGSGSHPCSVVVGDFDNNNKIDIAVANSGADSIGIFLGNGDGTFQTMRSYPTGVQSRPQYIAIHDIDNDYLLDIIVANSRSNNIVVFKGHKNGAFSTLMTYLTGRDSYPSSLVIYDFDKDNRPDIAITNNGSGEVLILTAYGVYPHYNQMTYTTGEYSQPYFIGVHDLNNDSYLDIIVANAITDNVGIFIGRGNGHFEDQYIYYMGENSGTYFFSIGDFNNDQKVDIVVVLASISSIKILLGNGDGTFKDGETYSTGSTSLPYSSAVGDINADGNPDIITSNYWDGSVGIFLGHGNGTFMNVTKVLSGLNVYPKCVEMGDLNGDTILDIIATDAYIGLGIFSLLGFGNGSFKDPIWSSTDFDSVNCFTIADLNNDNRLDLIYSNTLFSRIGVLLGYGNGSFGSLMTYSTGANSVPWFIAVGDLNNDGWPDIGVGNSYASNIGIFLTLKNGTFAPQRTFDTGYGSIPYTLAFGDLNNDHQLDVVVGNAITSNIIVFLVHIMPNFGNEASYFTGHGPHPYSIVARDLNNDNQQGIVVANAGLNAINILLDYKDGIFMNITTYSTGSRSHPQYVTLADFNNDNQLDIAVVNTWQDNINVFLRLNNETFNTANIYLTGFQSAPSSLDVGDLNRDGWTDIVVANQDNDNIGIFLGFDYATFIKQTIIVSAGFPSPHYMAVGDFNNDNQWDIVVANITIDSICVYMGYGNGTFATPLTIVTGDYSYPVFVAVGDFNNDNQSDIVVAKYDSSEIGVFLGYGNGTFDQEVTSYIYDVYYPVSIAVNDFNDDGYLDIILANKGSDNLSILFGYGDGTFDPSNFYSLPEGSSPVWMIVDDFNNDHIPDIAVANYDGDNIAILLGSGNGTFKDQDQLLTEFNSGPCSIASGDFNNDNWIDIAVANQKSKNIGIFFGYGDGRFSLQKTFPTSPQSYLTSIFVVKSSSDGFLDIVVSDWNNSYANIGILHGYGNGNFTLIKTYPLDYNSKPIWIAICDFNNDNRTDLAVSNSNKLTITIMLRDKTEPFAGQTNFATGDKSRPSSVTIGYFNDDDDLDIAVANFGTDNIGIFLGYGNGSFAPQKRYPITKNSNPVFITSGDFDNDSKPDIVVANSNADNINLYFGHGNGTFARLTTYDTGKRSAPSAIAVKDLNKDNNLDIVVTNWGTNNVLVFVGFGNGSFFQLEPYKLGYNARPHSVAVADFNNDSLMDIAVANDDTGFVEILLQAC